MHAIVIYDSNFGNTKKVAGEVAQVLHTKAVLVSEIQTAELKNYDLIVFGSPIMGWKPSEKIIRFLEHLKNNDLEHIKAAAFDTRVKIFIHGDAAGKMAQMLKKVGADIIAPAKGFFVQGREGPLLAGELEKAIAWAKQLRIKVN